ncbi:MAG TPA: hypothetical protein VH619_11740 [Verrucomicrobiae bacterium]|nr:hypothetical protein [Verrucomicrobiae bacterium]
MIVVISVFLFTAMLPMGTRGESAAASWHCSGIAALEADTNLTSLNKVLASPKSIAFREFALDRLSGLLSQAWRLGPHSVSLLSPLLADSLNNESCAAFSAEDPAKAGFVLAVRMDSQKSKAWQEALAKAFGSPGEQFTAEQFTGRRWDKASSGPFWIIPAHGWLLAGRGEKLASVQSQYLKEINRHGRPVVALAGIWLEGDLDLNALASFLPDWVKLLKPGKIHIRAAPGADKLEVNATVIYPSAISWNSKPWKLPKELVQNPLVSFTAGRDLAAFLQINPPFSNFDANPLTNQFCAWAIGQMPLQTYMTWPVSNATNAMTNLAAELRPVVNPILKNLNGTQLLWQPERERLVWSNLRVVAPEIQPARPLKDYLLLSLFPRPPFGKPAPEDLWRQLEGGGNVVYYDWEMTGARLQEWRLLSGMLWFRPGKHNNESDSGLAVKYELLGELGNGIGKTVTEITRTAPNELSIVRQGPLGLTGLEIVLLSDWLTAAGPQ